MGKESITAEQQLYIEYTKLVVENSMRAQRGLILCHGGAITAILMSGNKSLLPYALLFGLGAILAVICSALGYWTNFHYMNSRGKGLINEPPEYFTKENEKGRHSHRWAVGVGIASVALFLVGLALVYHSL